jgi:ubiquinone/menaquinone biosynthesis C-methylase UbiE
MIFKQTPLYRFLMVCDAGGCEKSVFDGGAGGDEPFLSVFSASGYRTAGIEIDDRQLNLANEFGKRSGQNLNIAHGDLRDIDFPDGSFGCAFSYNTIFHMMKSDVAISMREMKRIVMLRGFLFVNFLSVNDFRLGEGKDLGDHQYEQMDDDLVIHSYYDIDEADAYFSDMKILYKENRVIERMYEGKKIRQGFVDYIAQKV